MPSALIVEDEKNIVEVINRFLTAKGITVYATENGVEAVSLAKSKKPDMILLDINIQGFPA
jgi:CheY-like chemotaxis protein